MKQIITTTFVLLLVTNIFSQNVGIGTNSPVEKLEVNGGIKIGTTANTTPGTIRWNSIKNDFEGYNGSVWLSLTGNKGSWGSKESLSYQNDVTTIKLNSGANGFGTHFGTSMAASEDYLLAGAPTNYNTNDGFVAAGTVHLLKKNDAVWSSYNVVNLASPSAAPNEQFGSSVAIGGNKFVVGAPGNSQNRGRIYIFSISVNGQAVQQPLFNPVILDVNDFFGSSVSINSNTIMVGSPGKTVNGNSSQGKVYLYQYNLINNIWNYSGIEFVAPDGHANDEFGSAISVSGNYAAIGAPGVEIGTAYNAGKVYLYKLVGNNWQYESAVEMSNAIGHDRFGADLFLKNDTLIVGAKQYNGFIDTDGKGKVFVYVRNGADWELQATLTASDGKRSDSFGSAVYLNNGHIIVGAKYATVSTLMAAGKAYIFKNVNGSWEEQAVLAPSNPQYFGEFGYSVVMNSQMAFVGAPETDYSGRPNNGRIYFFHQ